MANDTIRGLLGLETTKERIDRLNAEGSQLVTNMLTGAGPAAAAARRLPQAEANIRRNVAGMGLDIRPASERLAEALAAESVDLGTSAGLMKAAQVGQKLGVDPSGILAAIQASGARRVTEEEESRAELARQEKRQQRVGQMQFIDASSLSDEKKAALKASAAQGQFSAFKDLTDAMGLEEWKAVGGSSNAVVNSQTGEIKTVDTGETMSAKDLFEATVAGTFDLGDFDIKSEQKTIGKIQELIDSGEDVTAAKVQQISNDNLRPKLDDDYEYKEVKDVEGNEILASAPRRGTTTFNKEREKAVANIESVNDTITRAEGTLVEIDEAIGDFESGETAAGIAGYVLQNIPGTNTFDTAQLITTIRANIGFDRLQAMRDASPTGGALGQVSNREINFLQATIASLSGAQTREQIIAKLKKVREHYGNILTQAQKRRAAVGGDVNTMLDYQLGYIDGGYRVFSKGPAQQQQAGPQTPQQGGNTPQSPADQTFATGGN